MDAQRYDALNAVTRSKYATESYSISTRDCHIRMQLTGVHTASCSSTVAQHMLMHTLSQNLGHITPVYMIFSDGNKYQDYELGSCSHI